MGDMKREKKEEQLINGDSQAEISRRKRKEFEILESTNALKKKIGKDWVLEKHGKKRIAVEEMNFIKI